MPVEVPIDGDQLAFRRFLGSARGWTVGFIRQWWDLSQDGTLTIFDSTTRAPIVDHDDWYICALWANGLDGKCDPFPAEGYDVTAWAYPEPCVRLTGAGRSVTYVACPIDGLLGVACSNSGTNSASDHPAWSGDNEERVEITAAQAVAAGNSMIAITTYNQTTAGAVQVYDEQGNTWTLDAEHENTASSGDNTVQIWRCNVTNALSAGDYVRFAQNLGSSLLPSSEFGARCIGVYAYAGTLSDPVAGTGAGSFSDPAHINTPAGDLVIAAATHWGGSAPDPTPDADWDDMIPWTEGEFGTGKDTAHVIAQQLTNTGATTWTVDWGGNTDWSAISVGYTRS